ncbi:MAG: Archaeal Glu-tRNAGln amidotransferase subunit E, GatE [Candidatus Methanohalarchaeum thermophilum]|uniref:Glutamyl-tRNA(Gln) amidotransferase subunit E n=1 Tax=Methanohalarchaeum thermophilum TaxID=1903181 RepID=A0A1Q6DXR2_METT1|nr:MAG: Archaeal Glu-tRNAGln amidotransferase subunit E, GatE [Candidatus Methanohalarchaeum thermophilum]
MELDFEELGLKVGFEFHQQLDTENKLFCNCKNYLIEDKEPDYVFFRQLHPTKSELGEVDKAALEESRLNKVFKYYGYEENTCLVENDEEPPNEINEEAIDITLEISELLNSNVVDQVHTMRKIVIDGSNTAGFQRTALVAINGYVETKEGKVGIENISLEEESAQKIEGDLGGEEAVYSLDRLGIPLIEIGSKPEIYSPNQAREFAEKVGMVLRSTGKVKRGLGTIRQDINISIEEGSRIELKGAQELDLIEDYIENEVIRQLNLIKIKEKLEERKLKEIETIRKDLTEVFEQTDSKLIKDKLKNGKVLGMKLRGFNSLVGMEIQENRRLGTEFSDKAKKASGVGGIFHTDELPKYGITQEEVEKTRKKLDCKEKDAVILVADKEEKANEALDAVKSRAKQCLKGVPEETRQPLDDGTSKYMRPLPGSARMYPETDVPPVEIKKQKIKKIKNNLPELIEEKVDRFKNEFNISQQMAQVIVDSEKTEIFEEIIQNFNVSPTIVYDTLIGKFSELDSDGFQVKKINDQHLRDLFELLEKDQISKEVIGKILKKVTQEPKKQVKQITEEMNLKSMKKDTIETVVRDIVEEKEELIEDRGFDSIGPLMGVIMNELDRRADGEEVSEILREEIRKKLS